MRTANEPTELAVTRNRLTGKGREEDREEKRESEFSRKNLAAPISQVGYPPADTANLAQPRWPFGHDAYLSPFLKRFAYASAPESVR